MDELSKQIDAELAELDATHEAAVKDAQANGCLRCRDNAPRGHDKTLCRQCELEEYRT